jgi:cytochrome c biogenesis protein CcdA
MKKLGFVVISLMFMILMAGASVNATSEMEKAVFPSEITVNYFWRAGCSHCANVAESGILEKVDLMEGVSVKKLDVVENPVAREKYTNFMDMIGIDSGDRGVPFVVVEQDEKYMYYSGDVEIISNLEEAVSNFQGVSFNGGSANAEKLTLWTVIGAAFIDSINPCAFGVLIFLMLSLLAMGSSKRALRAGLFYTFVVFVVYFLAGFGIFSAIQAFTSITQFIYLGSGILVLILGLWQFKDVFLPKFGPELKISSSAKPLIQKMIRKGTIPALILLGIVVSLFELPCTGGIYLAVLTVMAMNKTFGIGYLLLYNFIFVLPLIVLTLIIYKGASPERLQKWTSKERTWMKFAAGVVLVSLGVYILLF